MKKYAVVIEKAGSSYSAFVLDLPGCVATGESIAEVENNIREAIEAHITALLEDGEQIPAPSAVVNYVEVAA